MPEQDFLGRIRKGRVVQVLIVYLGVSWMALQVVATLRDLIGLPDWVGPTAIALLLIGLVVVAATAWVQSHPLTTQKESAGELPGDWEVGVADLWRTLKAGRIPHLNWGRVVSSGIISLSLLVGIAGAYVLVRDRGLGPGELAAAEAGLPVAVLPFAASGVSDVAVLGEGIMDLIATNLDAITGLRAISPRALPAKGATVGDEARIVELGRSVRAAYVVSGGVTGIGDQLRVHAELRDTRTGRRVGAPAQVDGSAAELLQLVDRLSVQLAALILERDPEFAPGFRSSLSLTGSPIALRAYLQGESHFRRLDFPAALGAYERALQADSTFALAWARKALTLGWVQPGSADIPAALHNALRDPQRLPERDRVLIEGLLAVGAGTPDYAALPALEAATRRYPDDPAIRNALAEFYAHHGADKLVTMRATYDVLLEAVELQPAFYPNYVHAIEYSIMLDDTARARELMANSANQLGDELAGTFRLAQDLAFGDAERKAAAARALDTLHTIGTTLEASLSLPRLLDLKERHVRVLHTGPTARGRSARILLTTLAVRGKLREAVALLEDPKLPPQWRPLLAHMLYTMQAPAPAAGWNHYLALARVDTTITQQLALVAAYAASQDDAASYARAVAHMRTQEQLRVASGDSVALTRIRARISGAEGYGAWRRGDLAGARRLLEAALPDAGWPIGGMVRWWLGEVLLALRADDEALRYYDSLHALDGDWNEFPLRRERMARIHERNGRRAEARAALEQLLVIWKDADRDHPQLAEVRARLQRL